MTSPRQVAAALKREAAKIDRANKGLHVFDPPYAAAEAGANWTANFRAVASTVPLDEMRAALRRVQAKYPEIEW